MAIEGAVSVTVARDPSCIQKRAAVEEDCPQDGNSSIRCADVLRAVVEGGR